MPVKLLCGCPRRAAAEKGVKHNAAFRTEMCIRDRLNISPQQMKYVTHTEAGEGLIF